MVNPIHINEPVVFKQISPCGNWVIEVEIDYANQTCQVVWEENIEPAEEADFTSDT